jgi:hypothetical protein
MHSLTDDDFPSLPLLDTMDYVEHYDSRLDSRAGLKLVALDYKYYHK